MSDKIATSEEESPLENREAANTDDEANRASGSAYSSLTRKPKFANDNAGGRETDAENVAQCIQCFQCR